MRIVADQNMGKTSRHYCLLNSLISGCYSSRATVWVGVEPPPSGLFDRNIHIYEKSNLIIYLIIKHKEPIYPFIFYAYGGYID